MGSISNLSSNYLQSILAAALQNTGLTTNNAGTAQTTSVNALQQDSNQLSPFAQVLTTLQQLQQSDPSKYQQITEQIASNLQAAAQTATTNGNSTAAHQLNQLATDFTKASESSQLPNVQDLAEAMGSGSGHGYHHHHHSSSGSSSSSGSTQSTSLNPLQIITSTLASAGITMSV